MTTQVFRHSLAFLSLCDIVLDQDKIIGKLAEYFIETNGDPELIQSLLKCSKKTHNTLEAAIKVFEMAEASSDIKASDN